MPMRILVAVIGLSVLAIGVTAAPVDIPAQALKPALQQLSRERNFQIVFLTEVVGQVRTSGVKGDLSTEEALAKVLEGTGLTYKYLDERTVTVQPAATAPTTAVFSTDSLQLAGIQSSSSGEVQDDGGSARTRDEEHEDTRLVPPSSAGIPEMLVKGARTSNTDIRRTEDDVQPYVVFDAEDIDRSMAPDLNTFLKTRLPMNQVRGSAGQELGGLQGNRSTVDLRGLGANQTLILVNGRRQPGVSDSVDFGQPDINGIPLSAVERIEVLPSTAGGIYGGGATGGVLNIILKRDYSGLELTARYDNTFAGGGADRRLDVAGGLNLEGGRTGISFMASYQDASPLYLGDREFAERSRALQYANNRDAFFDQTGPVHGYTTNIKSVSGNDLVLLGSAQSLGFPTAHVPMGYAGPASDGGAAFLSTAGQYNLGLADDLIGRQYSLIAAPAVRSFSLSIRREFSGRIQAFVDLSRYDNRASAVGSGQASRDTNLVLPAGPNNPFTEAVRLALPVPGYDTTGLRTRHQSRVEQVSGGLIVRLPRDWTLQGEYSWSLSSFAFHYPRAFLSQDGKAALLDGRLDPLRDVNAYPMDFSAYYPGPPDQVASTAADYPVSHEDMTLRLAGPLLELPGGPLRLVALLENREQLTGDQVLTLRSLGSTDPYYLYYAEIGATTESVYSELTAPLVSARNARTGLRGLDLQASYRYDGTKTRARPLGDGEVSIPSADGPFPDVPYQTNKVAGHQYTLGMRYVPARDLALRVSYGKGILPPSPLQLSEALLPTEYIEFFGLTDPKRGGLPVTGANVESFSLVGSLQLRSERSQSWSAGAILTPDSLPGFRLSVDYTRIEKADEITTLPFQNYLDLEDDLPGYIVREPLTPADTVLGYTGGAIRELNLGNVNVAHSVLEAFDVQADYTWETRLGDFTADAIFTLQPHLKQQVTADSNEIEKVGYGDGPLKWRVNAGVHWSRGALSLGWNMQYYDSYRIYAATASDYDRDVMIFNQGSEWIPTQAYHDVFGRYRFEGSGGFASGLLKNADLRVSVQNVFNHSPPILASAATYLFGGYSTEGDPRLRRYSIAFSKRFGQ